MSKRLKGILAALPLLAAAPAVASEAHASQGEQARKGEHTRQGSHPAQGGTARSSRSGVQTVDLTVTSKGFEPANVKVKAGRPVRLVVTRKTDKTCATEIVMADLGIHQPLPLDTPVTLEFTPSESGTLVYACAMDHISGVVTIQ